LIDTTVIPSQQKEANAIEYRVYRPGQKRGATDGLLRTSRVLTLGRQPANAVHGSIVSVTFTWLDKFNGTNSPREHCGHPATSPRLVANGPLPNK